MPFAVSFDSKKYGDKISFGCTLSTGASVFMMPRYNTGTTILCNYGSIRVSPGAREVEFTPVDTQTGMSSTSTTLAGIMIIVPD